MFLPANKRIFRSYLKPALQETLTYTLTRQSYQVISAGDGQTALHLARENRPELIVLDLMLPVPDGFEVCRIYPHHHGAWSRLPLRKLIAQAQLAGAALAMPA